MFGCYSLPPKVSRLPTPVAAYTSTYAGAVGAVRRAASRPSRAGLSLEPALRAHEVFRYVGALSLHAGFVASNGSILHTRSVFGTVKHRSLALTNAIIASVEGA